MRVGMNEDPYILGAEIETLHHELRDAMLDGDEDEANRLRYEINKAKKRFNMNFNTQGE